jgi:hypothetical protein
VHGDILCNSKLSGRAPEVLLSFSNISIIDDMSLHPCVKYNRCGGIPSLLFPSFSPDTSCPSLQI